jgi:hypothetical protein
MTTFKVFADLRKNLKMSEVQMEGLLSCICEYAGFEFKVLTEQAEYVAIDGKKILGKEKGWVGTRFGEKGFGEMTAEELEIGKFEYSGIEPDRKDPSRWIPVKEFIKIHNQKMKT